jgi:hypothetical protein
VAEAKFTRGRAKLFMGHRRRSPSTSPTDSNTLRPWLLPVLLLVAFGSVSCNRNVAQHTPAPPPIQAAVPQAQQQTPSQAQQQSTAPAAPHRLSPQEAEELFRSVDEILQFVSKDTGLPIKHTVKRQLASRDEVVKYVERKQAEDEDTQRLERSAASLKKFGLLPRDFDLRTYLLQLLKEQVAGFYDSKTKTVYLLDWVEPEAQRSVLAHELTHALQDQNYGLEKWAEGKGKPKTDPEIVANDEESSAKQAVIEGQAMITLLDYSLAPVGGSVVNSPEIVEAMKAGMVSGDATSPLFTKSPLFLREALVFPYQEGLDFVRSVLVKRGKQAAFAGTMENPPANSRQVVMPATYLAGEKIPPLPIADIDKIVGKEYDRYDFGGIGQFDIGVMVEQWAVERPANTAVRLPKKFAESWRGGYYWVGRKHGLKEGPVQMVFVTRWATEADATEFATIYGKSVGKRYTSVQQVKPFEWQTEEGPVRITFTGDLVIAVEGFDVPLSDKLIVGASRAHE